ncbi:GPP34 family phosphoprotein [Micromonospora sp. NPDC049559]|uniref:GOLPH3/VPS74 family protein n=1 Tax=Micromonospora sp. NPDC049559 TaxID=3155923 RepID=UPI0034357F87
MQNHQSGTAERLADELFLIGHDDFTGKPLAPGNLIDAALAGAVLGELAFAGRINIDRGEVYVTDDRPWHEPVTDLALAEIVRRGNGYAARAWLEFMRPHVREHVGDRLVNGGVVLRETSRGLSLRSTVRWPGVDPNVVARPRVRLAAVLQRSEEPLDVRTATLASLVRAGGLTKILGLEDRSAVERIVAARRLLPPSLADLLTAVDATISGGPSLARR